MKSKERIELTRFEKFEHYLFVFWFGFPLIFIIYFFIEEYLLKLPNPNKNAFDLIYFLIGFLSLSLGSYLIQRRRTYFETYKGQLSNKDFKKAVKLTGKELRWKIEELTNDYAKAYSFGKGFGSSEERIIIKKTVEKIFINSIRNPENGRNRYHSKRNKQNVVIFASNTSQIFRGEYVEKNIRERNRKQKKKVGFWKEKEWTGENLIMRISGYGIFFFLLIIGLFFISKGTMEGIFPIIISTVIGFTYIRADIIILKEKRKRRLKNK